MLACAFLFGARGAEDPSPGSIRASGLALGVTFAFRVTALGEKARKSGQMVSNSSVSLVT